jgi:acetyl esterase
MAGLPTQMLAVCVEERTGTRSRARGTRRRSTVARRVTRLWLVRVVLRCRGHVDRTCTDGRVLAGMPLDEATQAFLDQVAAVGAPPIRTLTAAQVRAAAPPAPTDVGPDIYRVQDVKLAAGPGEEQFRIRILRPGRSPLGILVYYHGGGWVLFDIDHYDKLGRILAEATGWTVVLVDYRKAPESEYPAAVEDSWAALNWAAENATRIAGDAVPLVVAGDSAGGNLAAVIARRARDAGSPRVSQQILIYPNTDCDVDAPAFLDPANQQIVTRESIIWFWQQYAPDTARRTEPDAAPARVDDVTGLPPTVGVFAEFDVLRAEGEAYLDRLQAAGVPVQSRVFPGQMHGFFNMSGVLPGADAAIDYVVAAIGSVKSARPPWAGGQVPRYGKLRPQRPEPRRIEPPGRGVTATLVPEFRRRADDRLDRRGLRRPPLTKCPAIAAITSRHWAAGR